MNETRIFPRLGHAARLVLRPAIISAAMLMISIPAFAGLGENVSSVLADQAHMQGSLRTTQSAGYIGPRDHGRERSGRARICFAGYGQDLCGGVAGLMAA